MIDSFINLKNTKIGNDQPIILIGGLNVIENIDLTYSTAKEIKNLCRQLDINFIFKASYDKANRSSIKIHFEVLELKKD